jgi:Holliday junction resolvasome RuvABC endonuclease subunit
VTVISGFDTATRLTGWAVGDGSRLPTVGVWDFPQVGADLGELGYQFERALIRHLDSYGTTHVMYEAPIVTPHDKLLTIRKLYGLGFLLETVCKRRGIICEEVSWADIKVEMTGSTKATKDDVVAVARRLGIDLPAGEGAKDAADATGAFLIGVRNYARQYSTRWDQAIHSRRGGLI